MSEGKSAHWGVIRGFAVQCHDAYSRLVGSQSSSSGTPAAAPTVAAAGEDGEGAKKGEAASAFECESESVVFLVSHGVSARPFACSYGELCASNAQLDDWVPTEEVRWELLGPAPPATRRPSPPQPAPPQPEPPATSHQPSVHHPPI